MDRSFFHRTQRQGEMPSPTLTRGKYALGCNRSPAIRSEGFLGLLGFGMVCFGVFSFSCANCRLPPLPPDDSTKDPVAIQVAGTRALLKPGSAPLGVQTSRGGVGGG